MSGRRFALALLAALLLAGCDTRKEPTFQGWVEAELIFVGPDETGRVEMLTAVSYTHLTLPTICSV